MFEQSGLSELSDEELIAAVTDATRAEAAAAALTSAGAYVLGGVRYQVDGGLGFEQVLVVIDGEKLTVADLDGEVLIEHTRPAPGVKYVGNGRPRGPRPKTGKPSPMS
ncbi:hypothetical protein [Mycolicibacterium neoaurum]|uniref:Integrase catalytic subunit n=1 Tax=Mycolicibacterium neoaurum TaxID=1795 RepID=A0AAV2WHW9_MYCNE|nr:hypothetical protein [Mycolicibacterium neoaurum]CDQ43328.1 integrase catalytic subunit [Mycolicibacterium neoaurum]